ncbi:MAG: alternative oxidase [Candidatus Caenarcaniphilales bacterium]|nr:alternative oxidase [Candidatus Caenarcaniphilales bacterium]
MSNLKQPTGYKYSLISNILFPTMDLFYGRATTFSKLKVLELIARIPYQSWEHNFFVWLTHKYGKKEYVERAIEEMKMARAAQDNEQWHLFILADLINQFKIKENFLLHVVLPQIIAFTYFYIISIVHFFKPEWSYKLNADFEYHAENAYKQFVEDNPQFKDQKVESSFFKYYGNVENLADLLLKFAEDERHHKEESLAMIQKIKLENKKS